MSEIDEQADHTDADDTEVDVVVIDAQGQPTTMHGQGPGKVTMKLEWDPIKKKVVAVLAFVPGVT